LSHGTDETQKDVKNWKLKTEEILIKCSQALSIPN